MSQKFHLSINTTNLEKSIAFYQALFGMGPLKVRKGYAKFDVASPALNFAINEVDQVHGNQLSHLGVQVAASSEVATEKARLEALGLGTLLEEGVDCCYSSQDKVWVKDPDGNSWEVFFVRKDTEVKRSESSACCV